MLTKDVLIDVLASPNLSQQDKVLLILASRGDVPLKSLDIVNVGVSHGLRQVLRQNVPAILAKLKEKGYVTKLPDGWILTGPGRSYIQAKLPDDPTSTKETELSLRNCLEDIPNPDTREFVEEAIGCLEHGLLKSAVVMSWVGAVSVLCDYVMADSERLGQFNERAKLRFSKWKPAVTKDDLLLMQEGEFLDILAHLSILPKNVKEQLKNVCLDLRNSCGHPSSIKIGKLTVQHHIQFLILNVYQKF